MTPCTDEHMPCVRYRCIYAAMQNTHWETPSLVRHDMDIRYTNCLRTLQVAGLLRQTETTTTAKINV